MNLSSRAGRAGLQVAWVTCVVFAVTSLPYVFGFWTTRPDMVYLGLMYDVADHAQYWSWVTASRAGLFISNTMTPEVNAPVFMNPMMWVLARVQMAFGLSFPALFQVWRFAATLALVAAFTAFLRAIVPDHEQRKTALWLGLLASGFGWVLVAAKFAFRLPDVPFPVDVYTVEPNTFWGLVAYPYMPLAQAFLLLSLLGVWRAYRRPTLSAFVLAAAAALGLALVHAYDLVVLYSVVAAFGAVLLVRDRKIPPALVGAGAALAAASAPIALYFQSLTSNTPLWRAVLAQYANAGVWTPQHIHLVVLMGLPLVLAAVALLRRGPRSDELCLVSAWAVAGLALVYLPVVFQIKMLGGWQFPLAILAAKAWHEWVTPLCARVLDRYGKAHTAAAVSRVIVVLLVIPTNVYLYTWRFIDLRRQSAPYYLNADEAAALDWLAANAGPDDVVLAPEVMGQFVPNYGKSRAYLAHWAMTNRYYERVSNVRTFFTPELLDAIRVDLARRDGVTLVLRAGAVPGLTETFDPSASPLFETVFSRPRAQVFRIKAGSSR
jgi:hypothetical protein